FRMDIMNDKGQLIYSGFTRKYLFKKVIPILASIFIFLTFLLFFYLFLIFNYGFNLTRDQMIILVLISFYLILFYWVIWLYNIPEFKIYKKGVVIPIFSISIWKLRIGLFIPINNIERIIKVNELGGKRHYYKLRTKDGNEFLIMLAHKYLTYNKITKIIDDLIKDTNIKTNIN
ncbi:hypothetical protein KAR91_62945, partial [Candidatus Pacearchaeota archaeon]|nr:hypothetical protein [Candidatus Pacearchaeota archaeon]